MEVLESTPSSSIDDNGSDRERCIQLMLQYKNLLSQYNLCISHLQNATTQAVNLRKENMQLQIPFRNLTKKLGFLTNISRNLKNTSVIDDFRKLSVHESEDESGTDSSLFPSIIPGFEKLSVKDCESASVNNCQNQHYSSNPTESSSSSVGSNTVGSSVGSSHHDQACTLYELKDNLKKLLTQHRELTILMSKEDFRSPEVHLDCMEAERQFKVSSSFLIGHTFSATNSKGIILLNNMEDESKFRFLNLWKNTCMELPSIPSRFVPLHGWKSDFASHATYVIGDAYDKALKVVRFFYFRHSKSNPDWEVGCLPYSEDRILYTGPIIVNRTLIWLDSCGVLEFIEMNGTHRLFPCPHLIPRQSASLIEDCGDLYLFQPNAGGSPLLLKVTFDICMKVKSVNVVLPPQFLDLLMVNKQSGGAMRGSIESYGSVLVAGVETEWHLSIYSLVDSEIVKIKSILGPLLKCLCQFGWLRIDACSLPW